MIEIRLIDWMSHGETLIRLEDDEIGMIVARNGVGKTAVRDALEFVYLGTGKLRGIDTKKDLAALSIRDGARACAVTVKTSGMSIRRIMNSAGTQKLYRQDTGQDEEPIALGEADAAILGGLAQDAIRMVLEPTEWFRLPSERRAELLIGVTSTRQSQGVDVILEAMTDTLQADTEAERMAMKLIAEKSAEEGLREGEKLAIEKRKEAKRKLDELDTRDPESDFEGIDLSAHSLEAHEARLAEIRGLRERAVVTSAEEVAAAKARSASEYDRLQELLGWTEPPLDESAAEDRQTAENGVTSATEALEKGRTALATATAERDAAAAAQSGETPTVEHPGQCPHLEALKCPAKPATFQKALEASLPEPPSAGEMAELEQAVESIEAEIQKHEQSLSVWQADLDAAEERCAANAERERLIAEQHEKVDAQEKRTRAADTEAKEIAKQHESAGGDGVDVDALEAKIEKGERVVHAKRAYDEAVKRHDENRQREASLRREIDCWHAIATEMKAGGPVERKAAGDASTPFLDSLRDFETLTGEITLEPDMTLRVGPEKRHAVQLSTSQRLGLGIALQHAFAEALEFPLLLCDAIDLFDGAGRSSWVTACRKVRHRYMGGIIGLATTQADTVNAPPPGSVTFHLTRNGGPVHLKELRHAQ